MPPFVDRPGLITNGLWRFVLYITAFVLILLYSRSVNLQDCAIYLHFVVCEMLDSF